MLIRNISPKLMVSICFILGLAIYHRLYVAVTKSSVTRSENCVTRIEDWGNKVIGIKLTELAKIIHSARLHARGTKTSDYLRTAEEMMGDILLKFKIKIRSIIRRHEHISRNVCPESYNGRIHAFSETTCTHSTPIKDLVTVLAIDNNATEKSLSASNNEQFLKSVLTVIPNMPVIFATQQKKRFVEITEKFPSLKYYDKAGLSDGKAYNAMAKMASTPYVLISGMIDFFTNDSRLTRLIREIESLGVAAAGGAWRNKDGHWTHGCFQSVYRNYSLKYMYGYDESMHECMFCDHITGPFLVKKEIITNYSFRSYNLNSGLLEDWFLRLKHDGHEVIACPDSMFHVHLTDIKNNFDRFVSSFQIHTLQSVDGQIHYGKCSKSEKHMWTKARSPCSLKFHADLMKLIMNTCEKSDIICEFGDGSLLGAVKLGKVLPWDKDADIYFHCKNYTAMKKLIPYFVNRNIKVKDLTSPRGYCSQTRPGMIILNAWYGLYIELFTARKMDTDKLKSSSMQPTKILFNGQWVNVPRNPGLYARNKYGYEIYKHASYWRRSTMAFKPEAFFKCKKPKSHDCLDRYNWDGSLAFEIILP